MRGGTGEDNRPTRSSAPLGQSCDSRREQLRMCKLNAMRLQFPECRLLTNRTLYVTGQVCRDANGKLVSGGLAEEFKQDLVNGEIFKAGGCDFSKVFKGSFPARSTYQVAALPLGTHMEIEVIPMQGPLTCVLL
ncbi:2-iminobutanoate/2-iminopropanoate deaminase-like [Notamacropus eugenii]|uniref:2-iminobutanoate/2-iminopropanoate deaminase-like n=1 Tax=Notamacropus eugenii TaxID=9315 RepID=UPI003B67EF83